MEGINGFNDKRLNPSTEIDQENNNNGPTAKDDELLRKRKACDSSPEVKRQKLNKSNDTDDLPNNTQDSVPSTSRSQPCPSQGPKVRLQVGKAKPKHSHSNNPKKSENLYKYGNYTDYYRKRNHNNDFNDVRLDVLATQKELFHEKSVLDIGCNCGTLSLEIAKRLGVKTLIGIDIDRKLAAKGQTSIAALRRSADLDLGHGLHDNQFPFNVKFLHGNYVLDDDILLEIERPQFDVILCLSVTKWIHLNFGDSGLKQAFRRMYLQLNPGGKLIIEPQSFHTYKRRKGINDEIAKNYKSIQFYPEQFSDYLLSSEVGFINMELMGVPENCQKNFERPIQVFTKA